MTVNETPVSATRSDGPVNDRAATTHSLRRTNPKGQKFLGTCVLCGEENLPMEAALRPCPNQRGLTQDDALIEAVRGDDD